MLYNLDLKEELVDGKIEKDEMVMSHAQLKKVTDPGMIVMEASRSEYERKDDSQ